MHKHIEQLMALHDGELSEEEAHKAQDLLDQDPEAQRIMAQLEQADQTFTQAYDEVLNSPVPDRLINTLRAGTAERPEDSAGNAGNGETGAAGNVLAFPRRTAYISLAAAAGLAAILITGPQNLLSPDTSNSNRPGIGAMAGLLQETLETAESGEIRGSDDGRLQVTPMATYLAADSRYCREYMALEAASETAGIACRNAGGTWELVSQQELGSSIGNEAYRAAEGSTDGVDKGDLGSAAALSYTDERRAIDSGWSRSGGERPN